jgi:hypothetical protein
VFPFILLAEDFFTPQGVNGELRVAFELIGNVLKAKLGDLQDEGDYFVRVTRKLRIAVVQNE